MTHEYDRTCYCSTCQDTEIAGLKAEIDALRQRANHAEVAIDLYARSCGWDTHCEYWVLPHGKVKVQIWPGQFYYFQTDIGLAVIAIRARQAADAAKEE
jgi:hypothetical protein